MSELLPPAFAALPDACLYADVNVECSYYTYQPVVDAKSQFPSIWDIASIVPGDTEAQTLFSQIDALINSTVGDVKIKGTPNGDFCESVCLGS